MLAIRAARISTASSPSRKTTIALFETTDAVELAPGLRPLGRVDELGVESDERRVELRARVLPLHELDKAGVVAVAVPEQSFDPLEE